MSIDTLTIQDFRNLHSTRLEFCPELNLILGDNAQGKTNLMEAIYFVCSGKSFRTQDLSSLIQQEKSAAILKLDFSHHQLKSELELTLTSIGKNLLLQGKMLRSWQKVHALLRVLVFTPDSTQLFRSSPSLRRRYFDLSMSFQFPQYTKLLNRYQQVLRQRNLLLEEQAPESLLDPFNQQWAELSKQILKMRRDYLNELLVDWKERLKTLTSFAKNFSAAWQGKLDYHRDWQNEDLLIELKEFSFLERRYRRTLLGPHLDSVQAFLSEQVLRERASQGQQRLVVIALKLAEADYFRRQHLLAPIFLLDDIGSELDAQHLENLLHTLKQLGAQTFLTTAQHLSSNFFTAKSFNISSGKISELTGLR